MAFLKKNWVDWAEDGEEPTPEDDLQLSTNDTEATQGKLQTLIGSCSETIMYERLTEDRLAVGQIISPIADRKIRPGSSSVFIVENIRCCKMIVGLTPKTIQVTNLTLKHYRAWKSEGCKLGAMVEVYDNHEPHTIARAMVATGSIDRITNMNATHVNRYHIEKFYYNKIGVCQV